MVGVTVIVAASARPVSTTIQSCIMRKVSFIHDVLTTELRPSSVQGRARGAGVTVPNPVATLHDPARASAVSGGALDVNRSYLWQHGPPVPFGGK